MLRDRKTQRQGEYELVMLEELVPQDHFLRKVDAAVDFSFIHDMCKDLYCLDNGRPAIEPELLFKMLLLGYLYGAWILVRNQIRDKAGAGSQRKHRV